MLEKYVSAVSRITRYTLYLATVILAFIVLINLTNIFYRVIFGRAFRWVTELSLILFVYSVMFSIPAMYNENDMITMDFLSERLGERGREILGFIVSLVILVFLLIFTRHSLSLSWGQRALLSRGIQIPRSIVTLPAVICGILLLLINIYKVIIRVRNIFKKIH